MRLLFKVCVKVIKILKIVWNVNEMLNVKCDTTDMVRARYMCKCDYMHAKYVKMWSEIRERPSQKQRKTRYN